jgi:predicted ATPase
MPPLALDYITIRGFKSIASIEKLPLKSVNVVIGSNDSGNSNFIGLFAFLHAIREGRLRDYVIQAGGAERVLHFGSKTTRQIDVHLSFGGEVNQYDLVLSPTQDDGLYPSSETTFFWDKSRFKSPYDESLAPREQGREAGISDPRLKKTPSRVRARLGGWRLYHMHDTSTSSPMRKTAKVDDNKFLRPDGSNLAAFLYYLQEKDQTSYSLIRRRAPTMLTSM